MEVTSQETSRSALHSGAGWTPYFLMLLQGVLYGFGDPISKAAYEAMPVFSLLSLRYLIALLLFLAFAGKRILQGVRHCAVKDWLLPSLCITCATQISNLALGMTAATSVAFLRSLSTVMTPLLALVFFRSRYHWRHIPIQLMVVVGLYLLCGMGGLSGFGLGEVLALLSALLMAGALVFGGSALSRMDPITLSAMQTAVSAVVATTCALVFNGGWNLDVATPQIWAVIVYLGICCTLVGFLLQNKALKSLPARTVALLQCFCPVMTAFFSYILLGEQLSAAGMIGSAIILACVTAETF
ncbi:MAG: DMT family transporter, partial [Oscillibacter sp.]|nr:DMT family transporter [Oscillibacter sp.]